MQGQAQVQVQAQEVEEEEQVFVVTPTAMVSLSHYIWRANRDSHQALWDYAHEIVQDNAAWARTHPQAPRVPHPPIPMSRRDKCILTLMAEERRDEIFRLLNEVIEVERLLGLEDM
jgi:hypothetical protein